LNEKLCYVHFCLVFQILIDVEYRDEQSLNPEIPILSELNLNLFFIRQLVLKMEHFEFVTKQ